MHTPALFWWLGLLAVPPSLRTLPTVLGGDLVNPDSYMRLVRLRDGLRAGHVGDSVLADGGGAGTVLHWSHLLDSLLVLLAQPLRLLAPLLPAPAAAGDGAAGQGALFVAAALCGPLSCWLLGAVLAWAVAPLSDRRFLWAAPLVAGLSPPVATYGALGVAHHHVLLLAACAGIAGCLGRAAAGRMDAGLRGGVAAAAAIWLTPETMPAIIAAFALPLLAPGQPDRRLPDPAADRTPPPAAPAAPRRAAACAGAAFAAVLLLAWLADPPEARWAAAPDRLSVVYLGLGAAVAAGFGLAACLPARAAALAPLLALTAWIAAAPGLLRGADAVLDPATARAFFADIAEMQPVANLAEAVLLLWPGLIAAGFALAVGLRRRSLPWLYAGGVALIAALLAARHVRFAGFPALCAAAALPPLLTGASALHRPALRPLARIGAFAGCLLLPYLPAIAGGLPPRAAYACPARAAQALLAPHAGAVVLTPVNDVPELLYRTGIRTVGSLYHRNAPAYLRLRAAWDAPPAVTEPDAVRATGAAYVLLCPARTAPQAAPRTLWDQLRADQPPPWLRRIGTGDANPLHAAPVLWQIVDPRAEGVR